MRCVLRFRLSLMVSLLTVLNGRLHVAAAQPASLGWSQVHGVDAAQSFNHVAMIDQGVAFAVGENHGRGEVDRLRWEAGRWTVGVEARFDAPLRAVAAIDASNAWAVGDQGLIVHRDAQGWHPMSQPVPGAVLTTIQMFGTGAEGLAGGYVPGGDAGIPDTPVVLRYTDGGWRQEPVDLGAGRITAFHAVPGGGWAIGPTTIWRYQDGRWSPEVPPHFCEDAACSGTLSSVHALSPDEAWAVGTGAVACHVCFFQHPWIIHRENGAWHRVKLPDLPTQPVPSIGSLVAVDFSDAQHGFAIGQQGVWRGDISEEYGPLLLHYVNGVWSIEQVRASVAGLRAVSLVDAAHALAVGSQGLVLSYGYPAPAEPLPPPPANGSFADPAFRAVWERTDLPVATQPPRVVPRSWMWGPQPRTGAHREFYSESPRASRVVQYFDKSRMEITHPGTPPNPWYVTNGLVVVELITGRLQLGDNAFEARPPSDEAVAGDPTAVNPHAPTYTSFRRVAFPTDPARATERSGQVVTDVLEPTGATHEEAGLDSYGITLDAYDEHLGHNLPKVFTDFFTQQGLVYEHGHYTQGPVLDWLFVLGLPISEPYWARVNVGGVEHWVLMQAFERRVLTYTPDNPPAWRVEMGNVGQHYMRWRYGIEASR